MQSTSNLTTGSANGYISGQIFYDAFNVRSASLASSVDVCSRLMSRARLSLQCAFIGLQCSGRVGISLQTATFSGHRAATPTAVPICKSGGL